MARKKRQDWTFDGEQMAPTDFEANVRGLTPADMNVVFQPIVDLGTGAVFGSEALARCQKAALKDPMILFKQAEKDHRDNDKYLIFHGSESINASAHKSKYSR